MQYELALAKARPNDVAILACLGRVWLLRGKAEKSLSAMKTSLEYSERALKITSDNVHFQFNVAFVQMQIAQLVITLKDSDKTLADVETAAKGLEDAIESFTAISKSPNPPFPPHDIEQRAIMGRNTMRNKLERVREAQQKYEQANQSKLEQARALREAELKKEEEKRRKEEEEKAERRRKILEEQERLKERDREYMEKRQEEERRRQELIDDSEMRKADRASRKKGGKRKRKDDEGDSESEGDSDAKERSRRRRTTRSRTGTEGLTEDDERPRQKKKRLQQGRKKEPAGKYKSSEMVVDSDEELGDDVPAQASTPAAGGDASADEQVTAPRPRKTGRVIDEDEDEDEGAGSPKAEVNDVTMDDDDE
jgi:RNA polymerase-associated protein CTR9